MASLTTASDHKLLQGFLADKGLTESDLVRIGTRIDPTQTPLTLVWLFPDGLKWRSLGPSGRRWSEPGTEWTLMKRITSTANGVTTAIVAEGETDGATLVREMGAAADVFILPAGAGTVTSDMLHQLRGYERVLVATDNDEAGEEGARKFANLKGAHRMRPPEHFDDWTSAVAVLDHLGNYALTHLDLMAPPRRVFSVRELVQADLGAEEDNQWFERPVLPRAGMLAIHGEEKSLKSVMLMEVLRACATGTRLAGTLDFIAPAPARCLLVQMEISPYDFRNRVLSFEHGMTPEVLELFETGVLTVGLGRATRVDVNDPTFADQLASWVEESEADVIAFDPVQRMSGGMNLNQSHEMNALMGAFARLGETRSVIYCHHNSKATDQRSARAMGGSQRFAADPDAICHMWNKEIKSAADVDEEPGYDAPTTRNFSWTLRSGVARGNSVTVTSDPTNHELFVVEFGDKKDHPEF
jgi:hypothetical protein